MNRTVYIETTIVSYLTSRPSRDLVLAARQQITTEWWERRRGDFDLVISQVVVDEAADGDPQAARRRLDILSGLPLLEVTPEAVELADVLVSSGGLPEAATDDAFHLAVAAVHAADFLLTWNCRHLANAERMGKLADVVRSQGFRPPIICTPDELLGDGNEA